VPYSSSNLFYEPLPYEFLFTNETQPQVLVSVDGLEAVCASLKCGYTYIQPTSSISSFSLSNGKLTIKVTNLTTSIKSITLGGQVCSGITVTGSSTLTCSVIPVAGSW
jgi:hypothetical protein